MQKFYYIFNSYFTFKPYYKWITFNTLWNSYVLECNMENKLLNLIINGLPSIPNVFSQNTTKKSLLILNLIINGLPSIPLINDLTRVLCCRIILNLIINGLPSIPSTIFSSFSFISSFLLNLIINGLPSIPLPKG